MSESPFGFEKPEDSPGFLLWQTTITWQRLIKKALEPYDIVHAHFVLLALLLWFEDHNYDTTQVLLVNWSKLDKMTVSKSLKKLANRKLVSRAEHEIDTRAKSVKLTEEGRTLIHKVIPIVEKVDAEFFGIIQENDQQALLQILSKLTVRIKD